MIGFLAVNCFTFGAFWADKLLAQSGGWRISEEILLMGAFFGGTPGAYAARAVFRHKTRKQPFSDRLFYIVMAQSALLMFVLIFFW